MSNLYDTPPTIEEIERQIRWEAAAVEMGVKRYRQEQRDANTVADTSAGARLIRETMQSLVPYLTDMQEAIRDKTTNSMGYKPDWWTYICLIEPEKLAYLTFDPSGRMIDASNQFAIGMADAVKARAPQKRADK